MREQEVGSPSEGELRSSVFGTRLREVLTKCANAGCRNGWRHLWRARSGAIFEGGWSCSAVCTAARIADAVRREFDGRASEGTSHRHRIPIGLVMLEQGWVTRDQLRAALDAQRASGEGRLGTWLVEHCGIDEQLVTRALSLQWNCPVLSPELHDPDRMACVLPRLFVDAFEALPLRITANKLLYLAFEERLDPVIALSLERMLRLRVETGLVRSSLFRSTHQRQLRASFPKTELIEALSEAPLVRMLTRTVEKTKPLETRLVRIHDLLWMRMWRRHQANALPETETVEDVICSLAPGWK